MGRHDGINQIRDKEMCICPIGLMHIYYSMCFYYLLLLVIHLLSSDNLGDVLMYLSLHVIRCISVGHLYVCQTVGVWIEK